uniref:ER lumen protein-retaining receptor n=1 Tax=Saimiri boliviensis boliviensis TaxID=39432 RepID=A0A2K6TCI3_SAIBB
MNIFRLTGDLSHLAAIVILLLKIWKTRSCAGISGKSQLLFALVFTTRYLDLFTSFISLYNTSMKVIYLACSYATVYLIYLKFKATYDGNHDTFRVEFLVVPVGGLSFLVNHDFSPLEILWTFSIYLESVAILPQLFMISKTGEAETITTHYLFFLGLYRALYLVNWIWRFYFEGFFDLIAVVAGVVQTILYCDFFYLYITKGITQGKEAQFASISAKDHHQHLSFRVLGQNSYHSKGIRCLIRKIRNLTLLLQIVISGSVRTQRKRARRFLFNASCLIFFYYCKLNAVLINSVCSFNWDSFKSEDFVRNKCKCSFFILKKFFETVKSLCLQ